MLGKPPCAGVLAPTEVPVTTLTFASVFMFFTIPGNLLVVLAIVKDPYRNMRTPFCGLVISLAMTDLIVGILVLPLSIYIHKRELEQLPITMSWLSQFTYFLLCTASLLSLTALTIDRYLSITAPLWYHVNATFYRACILSILVWLLAIIFAATFFKVGFILYSFVFANIALFFSLSILVFAYIMIFRKLKMELAVLQSFSGSDEERDRTRVRAVNRERKIVNAYMLMIAVFLLTYGPSCIMVYLMNLCTDCSCALIHWLRDMHFVFVTANSFLNPIVYAFRLPNFRSATARLFGNLQLKKRQVEPRSANNDFSAASESGLQSVTPV